MQGIIFTLRYKSHKKPDKQSSDLRHLDYIAHKFKEITFNPGCDFSLWGKLPNLENGDINDYDLAINTLLEVSKRRTVYRGVLSLDSETAEHKNMCSRKSWQTLIERNIDVFAKELSIKPENLCYTASFHFKDGHPHTHYMLWDNSDDVRKEFIPQPQFEVATDKIREAFNKVIFTDELHELYEKQDELKKDFKQDFKQVLQIINTSIQEDAAEREQLHLLFGEDYLFEGQVDSNINTSRLNEVKLQLLTQRILLVFKSLPEHGRIEYKFLPPQIKTELNAVVDDFLETTPQYKYKYEELINSVKKISDIYGNQSKGIEHHIDGLKCKLYTDLGNQTLKWIKDNFDFIKNTQVRLNTVDCITQIQTETSKVFNEKQWIDPTINIAKEKPVKTETNIIQQLVDEFPPKHTSLKQLFTDKSFAKLFNDVVKKIMKDPALSVPIADYSLTDKLEFKGLLTKDLNFVYPNEDAEQRASEILEEEKEYYFSKIERQCIIRYCREHYANLNETEIESKASEIENNEKGVFDDIQKKIGIPFKQSDYFKQHINAYKIVRQSILNELKSINQWDEQYSNKNKEWLAQHEQYKKEISINFAVRFIVNLSRVFGQRNWQHFKNSLLKGSEKSETNMKDLKAKLKQKSTLKWEDEYEL